MPFQSEKQRRYLWANEPEIARDWADTYGSRIEKNDGGISRIPLRRGGPQDWGAEAEAKQKGSANVSKDNPYSDAAQEENRRLNERVEASTTLRRLAEDKREEKVERFRNRELGRFGNKKTRDFFLNKVWQSQKGMFEGIDMYNLSHKEQEELYDKYMAARMAGEIDAYGNPTGGGGGGGTSYYPRDVHPGTEVTEVAEVEEGPSLFQQSLTGTADTPDYYVGSNPTASNIAWGKKFGADPRTMGLTSYVANGGRIPRAFGGIMDTATGRRGYFLGSIGKALGSVAKAAKKVFKSPIGKAALIGGAMYGANAGWFGGGMKGWVPGLKQMAMDKKWLGNMLLDKDRTGWSLGKLGILGASTLPFFMGGPKEEDEDEVFDYDAAKQLYADEIMRIKAGVSAGSLNPNQWSYLPSDYTYTGAEGGRAGYYAGGQSVPSDYTIEDAMMTTTQDKLGGITDVMKQADLYRQGSVGQFYAAQGGRIGYDAGGRTGHPPITTGQISGLPPQIPGPQAQRPNPMPAPQPNRMAMNPMMNRPMMNRPMMNPMGATPRVMAQEGGLMDLGGMEKDYRNDGGFVPIGGEEKADDVPARLSRNEFVFTADAVRGAGGGDIDKGAEIMENVMKNLEEGGQISEETQGLAGAQEMFGVSERLSEVV